MDAKIVFTSIQHLKYNKLDNNKLVRLWVNNNLTLETEWKPKFRGRRARTECNKTMVELRIGYFTFDSEDEEQVHSVHQLGVLCHLPPELRKLDKQVTLAVLTSIHVTKIHLYHVYLNSIDNFFTNFMLMHVCKLESKSFKHT